MNKIVQKKTVKYEERLIFNTISMNFIFSGSFRSITTLSVKTLINRYRGCYAYRTFLCD